MGIDAFGAVLAITAVGDTSRSDTVDGEGLLLIGMVYDKIYIL